MANCEKVSASLQEKLGNLQALSSKHTISRVPDIVKRGKTEYYEPLVLSIGPLHHQLPSVQAMQEYKLRFLQVFLAYDSSFRCLDDYVNILREWEERVRTCYEENINLSSDGFIEMILLDASFIVILYLIFAGIIQSEETRALINNLYQSLSQIRRDLFLAENQLPFFVVEGLCEMAFDKQCPEYSDYDIVSAIVDNEIDMIGIYASYPDPSTTKQKLKASNIDHILDLFRRCCVPSGRSAEHRPLSPNRKIPSAVQLDAAGVKFVAGVGGNLLDIQFTNGVLVIPKIQIEDNSESFLRSLVAFEMKYFFHDSYFVDYVTFLDDLINTREDVQILVRSGVINNWTGSDETWLISSTRSPPMFR